MKINFKNFFAGLFAACGMFFAANSAVIADDGDYTILEVESCRANTTMTFGGWVESGVYANSWGWDTNGPVHTKSNERTDFLMNQLYLYSDLDYTTQNDFRLGGRADLVYGVDALSMQSYGDKSFDFDWATNDHGYGLSMYQLYGKAGYKKLDVKVGKFITPIGWEGSASKNNFFYSHSLCYWLEPSTHSGAVADYQITDKLTLSGGWTAGNDTSFTNRYNDNAFLGGFTHKLTDKFTTYYVVTIGTTNNGDYLGEYRINNDSNILKDEYYIQSLCFEWQLTDRFTSVLQYNLRNDNFVNSNGSKDHYSSYGLNNHLLYTLNDKWKAGMRLGWARDNGGFGYFQYDPETFSGDYYECTLGLNWNPTKHISVRPEVRFDSVTGDATPYGDNKKTQVSGGFGFLYIF
ncbi:MAG: outer membrane beta-barrel protein [Thermoguttaceae bacterium]